jgi:hypothetical protein
LLLSASVTGMISAAVGVVALALLGGVRFRSVLVAAMLLGLALVTAGALQARLAGGGASLSPLARLSATTGNEGADANTLATRLKTDTAALAEIRRDPWSGTGLDAASGVVTESFDAHNLPLLLWLQGGLAVVLGFVCILIAAVRQWRRSASPPMAGVLGAATLAMLTFAMTAPLINQVYFWLPLLVAAGVASTEFETAKDAGRIATSPHARSLVATSSGRQS